MPDPLVVRSVRGGVVEKFAPGDRTTWTVATAQTATGGLLMEAVAGSFLGRTAQADSLVCIGVALHDAVATEKVTVAHEGVWMLTASGAIVAGNRIKAGAAGVAVAVAADVDPRLIIGVAMADISSAAQGPVKLLL